MTQDELDDLVSEVFQVIVDADKSGELTYQGRRELKNDLQSFLEETFVIEEDIEEEEEEEEEESDNPESKETPE